MKKFLFLFVVVAAIFAGCSKDDEDNEVYMKQLSGEWVENINPLLEVFCMELYENGMGYQWAEYRGDVVGDKEYIEWEANAEEIKVTVEDLGSQSLNYSLKGDTLSLYSGDESITYVRR